MRSINQLKRYKFTLIILLLAPALFAQKPKKVTEYHYKKLKSAEGYMLNNEKTGVWHYWTEDGWLYHTAAYNGATATDTVYDLPESFTSRKYASWDKEKYRNALQHQQGAQRRRIMKITHYQNKRMHGVHQEYYRGQLVQESTFENDTLNGPMITYHDGRPDETITYRKGVKHGPYSKTSYENDRTETGYYDNGQKHGVWTRATKRDTTQTTFVHDVQHGPFSYAKKGNTYYRKITGQCVDGKCTGLVREYVSGRLHEEYYALDGRKKNGPYTRYDVNNGRILERGLYKNDKRDSVWVTYDTKGETCTKEYADGNLVRSECRDSLGKKTHAIHYDEAGHKAVTTWLPGGKSKEILNTFGYEVVTIRNAKGKIEKRDTVYQVYDEGYITEGVVASDGGTGMDIAAPAPPPIDAEIRIAEVDAQFPGGKAEMMKFLSANLQYPPDAQEMNVQGKVYVEFTVERSGQITEVKIRRGIYPSLDKETIRVIKKMPEWEPGTIAGQPVRTRMTIPVHFKLD